MRRFYYHVLPITGLALLLGIMLTVAVQTYKIQMLQGEWIEYTEHWVDQRQEAIEDLIEYIDPGNPDTYKEFLSPYHNTRQYSLIGSYMMDPSVDRDRAIRLLHQEIGFTKEEAAGLVWNARTLRPLLGIENDFRKWKETVEHWETLGPLVDSIRTVLTRPEYSQATINRLMGRLKEFKQVSQQFNSEMQAEVEKANHELIYWANTLTYLLAIILLLSGSGILTFMYNRSNRTYKKFRSLFEQSPEAIAIADPNGTIQNVNESFEQLFDYKLDEIIGKDLDKVLTQTDQEYGQAKQITTRLRKGESLQKETRRLDKNGNEIPVLLSALPVMINDRIRNYFAVYVDIRELKLLEEQNLKLLEKERKLRAKAENSREQFKQMFDNSPVAIALLEGRELRYTYANEAYRQMYEVQDMLNKRIEDVFPIAKQEGYVNKLKKLFDTGESFYSERDKIEIERPGQKDNKHIHRKVEYAPIIDQQGDPFAIVITSVDITKQVEYRQQIQEQLEEKETLLEEIHHRVKNNLADITAILQLEQDYIVSEEAKKAMQDTATRIHTLADIHELLYESENLDKIYIDQYIEKLIQHMQHITDNTKRIDVNTSIESFTLSIGQAKALGMLLNEIIQNSYKHAFPQNKSGSIYITGELKDSTVQLKVGDNGVGFDPSSDIKKGLGLTLIEGLKKQLDAQVDRHENDGIHYSIEFEKDVEEAPKQPLS